MKLTKLSMLFVFASILILTATDIAAAQSCSSAAITKSIVLGDAIVSQQGFNRELDNKDLSTLKTSSMNFQNNQYNYREVIAFHNQTGGTINSGPQVATSLTSIGGTEDDYKDGVYLETVKGAIGYYVIFDTPINIGKATKAEPLLLNILGKRIDILSVANEKSFTARIWDEKEKKLYVGDSVFINRKSIMLKDVSQKPNTVTVTVSGTTKTITGFDTVNGVDIEIIESYYSGTKSERYAVIVAGKNIVKNIYDGDAFAIPCATKYKRSECKKENPDWVWDIDDLTTDAVGNTLTVVGTEATQGPTIGVINDYIVNDNSDSPPMVGGEYDFPNGGKKYRVWFMSDGSTSTKYMDLSISFKNAEDFSSVFAGQTAEPAFLIESPEDNSLEVFDGVRYKRTNKAWLSYNDAQPDKNIDIFYFDTKTSSMKLARTVDQANAQNQISEIGRISYGATRGKDMSLLLKGRPGASDELRLVLDVNADGIASPKDNVEVWLGSSNNEFNRLGTRLGSDVPPVVGIWAPQEVTKGDVFDLNINANDNVPLRKIQIFREGQLLETISHPGVIEQCNNYANCNEVQLQRSYAENTAGTYAYSVEVFDTDGHSELVSLNIFVIEQPVQQIIWQKAASPGWYLNSGVWDAGVDAQELIWKGSPWGDVRLGAKDENHRTKYGIVIVDPKSNGMQERIQLKIPNHQIKARLVVNGVVC